MKKTLFGLILLWAYVAFGGNAVTSFSGLTLVPTFNCVSIYANYAGDDNTNSTCSVQYRVAGAGSYKNGLACWTDINTRTYKGSIVYLSTNTTYEVVLTVADADGVPGQTTLTNTVTTWNEVPQVESIAGWVSTTNNPQTISQGGSSVTGMRQYGPSGTNRIWFSVNANVAIAVTVNANNVVLQNIDFIGSTQNCIKVLGGRTNVWIRNCTFTAWGWPALVPDDSSMTHDQYNNAAICFGDNNANGSYRCVVESCTINPPAGSSRNWSFGHPGGPHAIFYCLMNGQVVTRYNRAYGSGANDGTGHWYNDVIGGYQNESTQGACGNDSDYYGNMLSEGNDDALESDGGNRNVRIFGNYITNSHGCVSTAANSVGPSYLFRNLFERSSDSGQNLGGELQKRGNGGTARCYTFNNTCDAPSGWPDNGIDVAGGGNIWYQVVRNNIVRSTGSALVDGSAQPSFSSYDYDLYFPGLSGSFPAGQESHGINNTATYAGATNGFYLTPASQGYHAGTPFANFLDNTAGNPISDPNIGAFDERFFVLSLGPQGATNSGGSGGGGTITNRYASPTGLSSNTGISTNSPWPLAFALANAGASNTIFLMDGVYTQSPLTITSPWQTLKALNKWAAIIRGVTGNYSITAPATTGVGTTFDGLQFDHNQFTLEVKGDNCTVRNCWFHHTGVGFAGSQAASGVECGFSSGVLVEDCLSEFNGVTTGFNHGIYGGGTNEVIRNNVTRNNQGYGIIIDQHVVTGDKNCQIYQNIIYSNVTGNASQQDQLGLYNDQAVAPSSGLWTNYFWGNTIISLGDYAVILQDGTSMFTNNIIISTNNGVHRFSSMSSDVIRGDYTVTPQSLQFGAGSHDVISATANFVSTNTGLYWLASGSPARGAALSTVFAPVDWFGVAQVSVTDIGAVQYTAGLTADARVLDPSPAGGANYWTNITSGGSAPSITTQPVGATLQVSQSINLSVAVSGTPPFNFQWKQGSAVVQNGPLPTYTRPNAQTSDSGTYTCVVTNVFGTVTSAGAVITVTNAAVPLLGINPGTLNWGLVATSTVTPLSFQVVNVGSGTLNYSVTSSPPFSISSGATGGLIAGGVGLVTVNYSPTVPGQNTGNVTITNNTAGGSTNLIVTGIAYSVQNPTNMSMDAAAVLQNFILSGGTIYQNYDAFNPQDGSVAYLGFSLPNRWTNAVLYGMVEATNDSHNSFWINIDQFPSGPDPADIWDVTNFQVGLQNAAVTWRAVAGNEGGPTNIWNLGPGVHVINVVARESNTRLGTMQLINQTPTVAFPPVITLQPNSQTMLAGGPATFSVAATGTLPLAYQWDFNGAPIPGANQTDYTIASTLPTDSGRYSCVITNIAGSVTSFQATLDVTNATPSNVRLHFRGKKR